MEGQFCPKLQPVDEDLIKLDYDERLKMIEDEAQSLYSFCIAKGFSEQQIKECVTNLNGPPKKAIHRAVNDSLKSMFFLFLFVGMATAIWMSPVGNNLMIVHMKLVSLKLLPFWDWSKLYNEDCLIENPWLPKENVTYDAETCRYCINVVKYGHNVIDHLNNTNHEDIVKHYINNQQPVIVTDTTKDWESKQKLNLDEIVKLYLHDPIMSQSLASCNYTSTTEYNSTYYDIFNALNDGKLTDSNWHATWVNCEDKAGKILRRYYTRPYFLPSMIQCSTINKLIVMKGVQDQWFQFELSDKHRMLATWITVVQGSLKLKLKPYDECQEKHECRDAEVQVNAGETVFYHESLWRNEYTSLVDEVTIAIANPVVWDD